MPHKDPEKRREYMRAYTARVRADDPVKTAANAAKAAAYYQKKKAEDAAWEEKRKADSRRWYEEHGKANARERKGYMPLEEYLQQQLDKRRKSAAYMREWSKTEAGRRAKVSQTIKRRCGLSIDDYDKVYDQQQGNCKICGTHRDRYSDDRLHVDHCHIKGEFRALLCGNCNTAIGLLGESEETLMSAIQYLRSFTKEHDS